MRRSWVDVIGWLALTGVGLGMSPLAVAAEGPLVERSTDGSFRPGLIASWKAEGDAAVVLVPASDVDPGEIAAFLTDRLAAVHV